MARAAQKKSRIEISSIGKADGADGIDSALKDLIDDLIVPRLVEEFLRLYGPASTVKSDVRRTNSQPDSELNSTP
jgi:hypothetical protein